MEAVKPKKKKEKAKNTSQENVPLHDILNTDSAAEDENKKPRSSDSPQKKKKARKNEVSPDVASSSFVSTTESTGKQGAWHTAAASTPADDGENSTPEPAKKTKKGVENPALNVADETQLPGSVPDLKDTTLDSMPISPPVASSTVIDNDDDEIADPNTGEDSMEFGNESSRPGTPRSRTSASPRSVASNFHRTLFGRPSSASKVKPVDKENIPKRPQTAPGYRIPFEKDFTSSSSQKRPATAVVTGARQAKTGRMDMTGGSQSSLREKSFNTSTRSLKDPPELAKPKEAVAYVPYMHARNALTRVIDDMKSMKMNHLSIVAQIEEQYHGIENDSRDQFNAFVISLQDEHKNKLDTFTQSVETYNAEVKERNKYWAETLQSLSKRNKELLRQKQALYLAYQTETQKLENERNTLQAQLYGQIGEQDSKLRQLESQLEDGAEDSHVLAAAVPLGAAVAASRRRHSDASLRERETQTDGDFVAGGFAVVEGGDGVWKERYEKEKEEHREQSERMERELQQTQALLASSGSSTQEEREAYEGKIKDISKELVKTKLEYDMMYAFAQSIMAATGNEEEFKKAMKKIEDDRAIMLEEKEKLEKEIAEFEEKWKKDHDGKAMSIDEKPDAYAELETQLSEVEHIMSNLDQQEQALLMIKEGRMPEAKTDLPEPMVTTIEVRDPVLVKELETTKSEVIFLEQKLKAAQDETAKASASIPDQEMQVELDDAKRQVDDLRSELEEARAAALIGISASADFGDNNADVEDLMKKLEEHQKLIEDLESDLKNEKERNENLTAETAQIRSELDETRSNLKESEDGINARVVAATAAMTVALNNKEDELKECNARIDELEQARLQNLDVDSRTEIERAKKEAKIAKTNAANAKKEKNDLEIQIAAKDQKIKSLDEKVVAFAAVEVQLRSEADSARKEKQKALKQNEKEFKEKERKRKAEEEEKNKMLQNKIRKLEAAAAAGVAVGAAKKAGAAAVVDPNMDRKMQRMEAQLTEFKRLRAEDQNRIKDLDRELKEMKTATKSVAGDKEKKAVEKKVKDLEKKLEMETKKFERELKRANDLAEELEQLKKDHNDLDKKYSVLSTESEELRTAAALGATTAAKLATTEKENKQLTAEVKTLTDNYNTERVLRKKYYNMVEDMKGKIRVYCRYRPMSKTELGNKNKPVVKAPDEYTVQVEARGNLKEFQFDQVFTSDSTQEQIFEDTYNLVQSAVDGYNVCIFAYGQTGSGKTYTMIGDGGQTQPGIAPRAFERIFNLIEENKGKLRFEVSCYMLELYNEMLVDLLAPKGGDTKLDVKKDKKRMVFVQGSTVLKAGSSKELYSIFEKGSQSRHVASTKMNAESSRSHLVVAVILESVNLTTGAVTKGKLSLVDLAGSERVGKTGATAQQLKEANSINKSLSALGDVISALSSEQSFIPYRNNKLTMLMQDSLGGNAKTLMFVNISPADYNADETAISLTYASRVKLITNDASKNADSREVARLKTVISKMKAGEAIEEDE